MLQTNVFEIYKSIFDLGAIDVWFSNGYNSIRIRYRNKKEVIFTYMSDANWKLETLDMFIESIKK